ncbi:hypothetical protein BH23GEM10_BH23GEM10_00700 [soil metagenome]
MHGASHCRVQESRSKSAMNETNRIVVILSRITDEDGATFCYFGEPEIEQHGYGRGRQLATDQLLQIVHTR